MKKNSANSLLVSLLISQTLTLLSAQASVDPEKETALLSSRLKPISDSTWKEVAGQRIQESYDVTKGDTLWDISKRLFGDSKYWPKIWALNNHAIRNPHVIRPGYKIAFMPGTGNSLPEVQINSDAGSPVAQTSAPNDFPLPASGDYPDELSPGKPQEWRSLPKQRWENIDASEPPPAQIDPLGFDRSNRITFSKPNGFEIESFVSDQKLSPAGVIQSARSAATWLSVSDLVYLSPKEDLRVGEILGISRNPFELKGKSGRGYAYQVLGTLKVLEVGENVTTAVIQSANAPVLRGDMLIPKPSRIPELTPKPATETMDATLLLDLSRDTTQIAQHHFAFVDRGTSDGIQPGMIFRSYTQKDRGTGKKLTETHSAAEADLMVVQTSETHSTCLVIRSEDTLSQGEKLALLTDVSSLLKLHGVQERTNGADDLDKLDNNQDMTSQEAKELEQLEKHGEKNPKPEASGTPAPLLSPSPTPKPEVSGTPSEADLPPPDLPEPAEAPSSATTPAPPVHTQPAPAAPANDEDLPPPPLE